MISLHKLYSNDDSLINAKVDYRLKLPANPHYVRRTLYKNDGKVIDIFTVADEVFCFYWEIYNEIMKKRTQPI